MNEKMKNLKAYDSVRYNGIDLDRLVIYTIVVLNEHEIELSLENIIVGAFRLFPDKFSLVGYSEFPDATRIEKALWRCKGKNRQWIGGKTPHGYIITDKTKFIASQTESQLVNPELRKYKVAPRIRRKESILREVTNSPAYNKFLIGNSEHITKADFCYLLQGTLDSSKETLRKNLISLKKFTEELERNDILEFLDSLEKRFNEFLNND